MKSDTVDAPSTQPVRYRVIGMDCPSCASKIETTVRAVPGVEAVKVSIASGRMTVLTELPTTTIPGLEAAVTRLGYALAPGDTSATGADDDTMPDLSHTTPAYRHALWVVVGLNLGYGLIEIVVGFLADSQALKADALDFVGDGAISLLGLIAIGWGVTARARTALMQGAFLGILGLGVLATTLYRIFVVNAPEAGLMGIFGAVALVINVAAAAVLVPHRKGDANVRAVWLFSRNDAIGNLAVIIAAALVAWTGTPWPDLVVATVIAALFLHSSWSIISDAKVDLTGTGSSLST